MCRSKKDGFFGGSGHGESPENKEAETHPTQGGKVWNPAWVEGTACGGITIGRTDGRSRWDAGANWVINAVGTASQS